MAETPPNASPRPAVTPWRRPNLQLSHGGQQQQWPAASTVHGSGSSSGASSGSSSGAGIHRQRRVSEVMPRDCLITPAHAARGLGVLAAVAWDRGSERGVTARPEAGSRGHAPSATNAEVKFSDVGGHIRGARHGRQQRLVGGPGGDPHLGGYLGRRPEGWQRRRGAQSQPRLRASQSAQGPHRPAANQDQLCPLLTSGSRLCIHVHVSSISYCRYCHMHACRLRSLGRTRPRPGSAMIPRRQDRRPVAEPGRRRWGPALRRVG